MSNDPNAPPRRSAFRPTITAQINLGNVLAILSIVAGGGYALSTLDSRISDNATALKSVQVSVQAVREFVDRTQDRLRAAEIAVTRQDERTNSILTGIARIEGQLRMLDERLNGRAGR